MKKFLTYSPLIKRLRLGEYDELAILAFELGTTVTAKIKVTRKNATTQIYSYPGTITGRRMSVNVAVPTGETFSNIWLIEVWVEVDGGRVTDIHSYMPDTSSRKNPVRVGWLNSLGGVDYYTFYGSKKSEVFSEKNLYQKDLPVNYSISDRGSSVSSTISYEEVDLISDFEAEPVFQWLSGILTSPEVWITDGSQIQSIIVNTKNHPIITDELIQFRIKYRLANDKTIQNG